MKGLVIIKIYGANTNIYDENKHTKHIVTRSEVEALGGVEYFELDVLGLYANLETKAEAVQYMSGNELTTLINKVVFEAKGTAMPFPNEDVNINSYYYKNVLDKRYKWLDLSTYPIRPNNVGANDLFAVSVTNFSLSHSNGKKSITLNIKER